VGAVVLSTTGSLGDFLPFLAVAEGLRDRGHRVRLALPTEFREAARTQGFDDVVPAGWEISPSTLAALDVDWSKAAGLALLRRAMNELVLPQLEAAYQALLDAAEGQDLIVGHANQVVAPMIAERTGVAWAVLSLFPMLVPTTRGLPGTPIPQLPGPFRRAGNLAAMGMFKLGSRALFSDRAFNSFRAAHGFGPRHAYFMTCAFDSDLYLAPVPPEFVARPSDWPANAQLSGFCPGRLSGAAVPADVEDFLADGDPPVLVTLGSAPSSTSADRFAAIAAVLDKRGLRGLFLVGRDDLIAGPFRDRAGVSRFAPLPHVLQRCRAVIHHGGYGTTAEALIAGVPSVVVPFMSDQLWYGRQTEAIGAGVVLPWRRHRQLARTLDEVLAPDMLSTTKRLAATLQAHDGVATTCDALERLLDTPRRPRL
jgi:UDP:flavonoid glycosyltransferase YjiC (YdhE family)